MAQGPIKGGGVQTPRSCAFDAERRPARVNEKKALKVLRMNFDLPGQSGEKLTLCFSAGWTESEWINFTAEVKNESI